MKKAVVIGSGFAGLSAASFLAKGGWEVTVLEKHELPGGRARKFSAEGFTFDMGPSWYWMPDVFERYFRCFGKNVSDFYSLERLDPSYTVYYADEKTEIPADYEALRKLFEATEPGSGANLDVFLKEAAYKYEVGINKLVHQPGLSFTEFMDMDLAKGILKLDVFTNMKKHISKYFKHPHLQQLLEFPVLFLGAMPQHIPALYSLMNHADMKLGTWYPQGGMYSIVKGMYELAAELGVQFKFQRDVTGIQIENGKAVFVAAIRQNGEKESFPADAVIAACDYHFTETKLLPSIYRNYNDAYWKKRVMAPSCLLYYIGINKKLKNIGHHSLFFDVDFDRHGKEIYEKPQWPTEPLFYVSAVSVSDETAAPAGCENLFFLVPVAAGLFDDTEELRDAYFYRILERFESRLGETIRENIIYKRSYAVSDFVYDYNAFKGNAYGLANTLMQTAIMKPSLKNKKVKNLFYAGQLTVPGPGVPPALISGEVCAKQVLKEWN